MYLTHSEFCAKYLLPYSGVSHLYDKDRGYIVWRRGTGGNMELLHLRSFVPRQGHAQSLVKEMVIRLKLTPPYYSVFGFGLQSRNLDEFYKKVGFRVISLPGPTKDAGIFFWQSFEALKAFHGV